MARIPAALEEVIVLVRDRVIMATVCLRRPTQPDHMILMNSWVVKIKRCEVRETKQF
jgi:hypothetical protein